MNSATHPQQVSFTGNNTNEILSSGNSDASILNSDAPQNPLSSDNSQLWQDKKLNKDPRTDYELAVAWYKAAALSGTNMHETNNEDPYGSIDGPSILSSGSIDASVLNGGSLNSLLRENDDLYDSEKEYPYQAATECFDRATGLRSDAASELGTLYVQMLNSKQSTL